MRSSAETSILAAVCSMVMLFRISRGRRRWRSLREREAKGITGDGFGIWRERIFSIHIMLYQRPNLYPHWWNSPTHENPICWWNKKLSLLRYSSSNWGYPIHALRFIIFCICDIFSKAWYNNLPAPSLPFALFQIYGSFTGPLISGPSDKRAGISVPDDFSVFNCRYIRIS